MSRRGPSRYSLYAVASAIVAFLVDGLYLRELTRQAPGYPEPWWPVFLASAMACLGVAALAASLIRLPQLRHALLAGAAIGFFLLAAFFVPLVLAGCFCLVSLVSSVRARTG
jgi:peptidoglycan biosynthesis protein MviN/MurJ (putative lipid II flippase)